MPKKNAKPVESDSGTDSSEGEQAPKKVPAIPKKKSILKKQVAQTQKLDTDGEKNSDDDYNIKEDGFQMKVVPSKNENFGKKNNDKGVPSNRDTRPNNRPRNNNRSKYEQTNRDRNRNHGNASQIQRKETDKEVLDLVKILSAYEITKILRATAQLARNTRSDHVLRAMNTATRLVIENPGKGGGARNRSGQRPRSNGQQAEEMQVTVERTSSGSQGSSERSTVPNKSKPGKDEPIKLTKEETSAKRKDLKKLESSSESESSESEAEQTETDAEDVKKKRVGFVDVDTDAETDGEDAGTKTEDEA